MTTEETRVSLSETNPDVMLVATDRPGDVEAEYCPQGWLVSDLYAKPWYPELCQGKQWAVKLFRTPGPKQRELL